MDPTSSAGAFVSAPRPCEIQKSQLQNYFARFCVGAWEGQMGSCERKCLPLAEQIELARKNGVSWVQFWHHDCVCPECVKVLEEYRKRYAKTEAE